MSTITAQRIFATFQSRRHRRGEHIARSGSYFNDTLSTVAHQLGITMEQARTGYIEGYAAKHNISVEESTARLNALKLQRVANHDKGQCTVKGDYPAYMCTTAYPRS